jgi:hypothetical protein
VAAAQKTEQKSAQAQKAEQKKAEHKPCVPSVVILT